MPESVSDRGFSSYKDGVKTTYGDLVRVYESSAAMSRCMWLKIEGEAHLREEQRPFAGIPFGIAKADISAHCTEKQARQIYEGIGEFLGETLDVPQMSVDKLEDWLGELDPEDFIKAIHAFARANQSYVEEVCT